MDSVNLQLQALLNVLEKASLVCQRCQIKTKTVRDYEYSPPAAQQRWIVEWKENVKRRKDKQAASGVPARAPLLRWAAEDRGRLAVQVPVESVDAKRWAKLAWTSSLLPPRESGLPRLHTLERENVTYAFVQCPSLPVLVERAALQQYMHLATGCTPAVGCLLWVKTSKGEKPDEFWLCSEWAGVEIGKDNGGAQAGRGAALEALVERLARGCCDNLLLSKLGPSSLCWSERRQQYLFSHLGLAHVQELAMSRTTRREEKLLCQRACTLSNLLVLAALFRALRCKAALCRAGLGAVAGQIDTLAQEPVISLARSWWPPSVPGASSNFDDYLQVVRKSKSPARVVTPTPAPLRLLSTATTLLQTIPAVVLQAAGLAHRLQVGEALPRLMTTSAREAPWQQVGGRAGGAREYWEGELCDFLARFLWAACRLCMFELGPEIFTWDRERRRFLVSGTARWLQRRCLASALSTEPRVRSSTLRLSNALALFLCFYGSRLRDRACVLRPAQSWALAVFQELRLCAEGAPAQWLDGLTFSHCALRRGPLPAPVLQLGRWWYYLLSSENSASETLGRVFRYLANLGSAASFAHAPPELRGLFFDDSKAPAGHFLLVHDPPNQASARGRLSEELVGRFVVWVCLLLLEVLRDSPQGPEGAYLQVQVDAPRDADPELLGALELHGSGKPEPPPRGEVLFPAGCVLGGTWKCPQCTLENIFSASVCDACRGANPYVLCLPGKASEPTLWAQAQKLLDFYRRARGGIGDGLASPLGKEAAASAVMIRRSSPCARNQEKSGTQGTARPLLYALLDYYLQKEKGELIFVDAGAGEGHAVNIAGVMGFRAVYGFDPGDFAATQTTAWSSMLTRLQGVLARATRPQISWDTACHEGFTLAKILPDDGPAQGAARSSIALFSFYTGWKPPHKKSLLNLIQKDQRVRYAFLIDRHRDLVDMQVPKVLSDFVLECHAPVSMAGPTAETFRMLVFKRREPKPFGPLALPARRR